MKAKKTSLKNLDSLTRHAWEGPESLNLKERALYTQVLASEQYDFICVPKPESQRLVVFFSGDARRNKFEPPVFQRWSWASKFPATCLFFSDPALYHHKHLGLAWYAGFDGGDYLEQIWKTVAEVAEKLGVEDGQVFSYGSSGGGYAALRSARYFPGLQVIAVNPQTELWHYPEKWTKRLASACYGVDSLPEIRQEQHYKFSALDPDVGENAASIFLAQNELDVDHLENHYRPFVRFIQESGFEERLTTRIFSDESGHAGAEDKGTFEQILTKMSSP